MGGGWWRCEVGNGRGEVRGGRWEVGGERRDRGGGMWEVGDGRVEMGSGRWEMGGGGGKREMAGGRWEEGVGGGMGGGRWEGWTGRRKVPIFDRGRRKWVPARGTYGRTHRQTDRLINRL